MAIDLNVVARAISGTREGLEASGFAIECADNEGRLLVTIRAGEGACAECLVPKRIFTSILRQELTEGGLSIESIEVVYPVEIHDELR